MTKNWEEKKRVLLDRFSVLKPGDLEYEKNIPGEEDRMLNRLVLKLGMNKDQVHQLLLNLLTGGIPTGPGIRERKRKYVDEWWCKSKILLDRFPVLKPCDLEFEKNNLNSENLLFTRLENKLNITETALFAIMEDMMKEVKVNPVIEQKKEEIPIDPDKKPVKKKN